MLKTKPSTAHLQFATHQVQASLHQGRFVSLDFISTVLADNPMNKRTDRKEQLKSKVKLQKAFNVSFSYFINALKKNVENLQKVFQGHEDYLPKSEQIKIGDKMVPLPKRTMEQVFSAVLNDQHLKMSMEEKAQLSQDVAVFCYLNVTTNPNRKANLESMRVVKSGK